MGQRQDEETRAGKERRVLERLRFYCMLEQDFVINTFISYGSSKIATGDRSVSPDWLVAVLNLDSAID